MSEHTPTTADIRNLFSWDHPDGYCEATLKIWFDRWLDSVKAEVWDECGRDLHGDSYPDSEMYLRNPYREGEK